MNRRIFLKSLGSAFVLSQLGGLEKVIAPSNKGLNWEGYFSLLNDLAFKKQLNFKEASKEICDKLTSLDYGAVIFGETHSVEDEKETASRFLEDISQSRKIGLLLEEEIGGDGKGTGIYSGDGKGSRTRAEHLKKLGIQKGLISDQFSPCPEVVTYLKSTNPDLLATYTGSMHTDGVLLTYDTMNNIHEFNYAVDEWVTVRDCVENQGKKVVSVIMIEFEHLIESSLNCFLRDLVKKNPVSFEQYLAKYEKSLLDITNEFETERIFMAADSDVYLSTRKNQNVQMVGLDTFSAVWNDKTIREKITDEGLHFRYVFPATKGKDYHGSPAIYFSRSEPCEKGLKIYVRDMELQWFGCK